MGQTETILYTPERFREEYGFEPPLMVDLKATNEKLVQRAIRIVRQAAGVEAEEALAALEKCGFSCKTAIVMLLLGLEAGEAEHALAAADGRIARALSPET